MRSTRPSLCPDATRAAVLALARRTFLAGYATSIALGIAALTGSSALGGIAAAAHASAWSLWLLAMVALSIDARRRTA